MTPFFILIMCLGLSQNGQTSSPHQPITGFITPKLPRNIAENRWVSLGHLLNRKEHQPGLNSRALNPSLGHRDLQHDFESSPVVIWTTLTGYVSRALAPVMQTASWVMRLAQPVVIFAFFVGFTSVIVQLIFLVLGFTVEPKITFISLVVEAMTSMGNWLFEKFGIHSATEEMLHPEYEERVRRAAGFASAGDTISLAKLVHQAIDTYSGL